jgi:hypothetical protein
MLPAATDTAPAEARLRSLLVSSTDGDLDPAAEDAARALGPERAGAIVSEILLADVEAPDDESLTAMAAARLAGTLRLENAIPALLACVEKLDPDDLLSDAALGALMDLGAPVLGPALAAFERCGTPDGRGRLSDVLARLKVRDERVLAALVRVLDDDATVAAMNLGEYDDPQALPALSRALDATTCRPADLSDIDANADVVELANAIEKLGGVLTPEQRAKFDETTIAPEEFQREWDRAKTLVFDELDLPRAPVRRAPRPGRNDPCHCGSGKKYKKCHLATDDA